MIAVIIKVQGTSISHKVVDPSTTFDGFVELVSFENFGKDIIIDDLIDVFVPETDTRYSLQLIDEKS
jgi:hypothetical protein